MAGVAGTLEGFFGTDSEPLGDLKGAWNEVPASYYGVIDGGHDELKPFAPQRPPSR